MTRSSATRKATNVTIESGLLATAKSLKINISQAAESGIARAVAAGLAQRWLEDNRAAMQSCNAHVERKGLPLGRFRNF